MVGELCREEWSSGPVMVAHGFWQRLGGIHLAPRCAGVLIPGWSVHGLFILRRLWAIGLTDALEVVGVRSLGPGGLVVFKGAGAVLEVPGSRVPPRPGWRLSWKGGVSLWPVR